MLLLIFRGHQKTSVLHPEEIWGQRFHLDVLFSSKAAKFYWFILFCTFLASCFYLCKCSFEQNTRNLIVCLRNLSEKNNFFFLSSSFLRTFFRCPCLNATIFSLNATLEISGGCSLHLIFFQDVYERWYSQTCITQPLLGPLKSGCLGQVVII